MGIWDRPELQTRPGLEPQGFDTIRALMMRKMMESQANPYGFDRQWGGQMESPFMPVGRRSNFDPYGGGGGGSYQGPGGGRGPFDKNAMGWGEGGDQMGGNFMPPGHGGFGGGRPGMGMRQPPMGGRMMPRGGMDQRGGGRPGMMRPGGGMGRRPMPGGPPMRGGGGMMGRPGMMPSGPRMSGQRPPMGGRMAMLPERPGMGYGGEEDEFVGSDGVLPIPSPWPNQPAVAYDAGPPGNPGGGLSGNTGYGGIGQPGWTPQTFGQWFMHKDPGLFDPSWTSAGLGAPPPAPAAPPPPTPGQPGAPPPGPPAGGNQRMSPTMQPPQPVAPWDEPKPFTGSPRPTQTVGGTRPGAGPSAPTQPSTTGGPTSGGRRRERGGGYDGRPLGYDGQDMAAFMKNMLLKYQKQQSNPGPGGRRRRPTAAIAKYKKGGSISGELNPNAAKLLEQLRRAYLNPGGGWMGNDTVGGGQVFGGFFRGDPRFRSDRSPSGLEGVKPNVGYTGFMRGDAPGMTESGMGAFNRLHENLNDPVGVRIGQGWSPERLREEGWLRPRGDDQMNEGMEDFFRPRGGGGGGSDPFHTFWR